MRTSRKLEIVLGLLFIAAQESLIISAEYSALKKGITSFGAAVIDDWLYVYGGHFGGAHHYSNTSQSDELTRLNLKQAKKWELVAKGPRLQGLGMVAHRGKLYRIGGFTAYNDEGAEHDLQTVADCVCFDPATGKWQDLPSLPEPRSSHDAVVIGDRVFVAGGWQLGNAESQWHKTAWVMDLAQEKPAWKQLPTPPFQRRALSLGHLDGKLFVIGGMQKEGGPTTQVDIYDPSTGKWSKGASLIDPLEKAERGKGMEGFGSSAFTVSDKLFVSTYGGNLQCLDANSKSWRMATRLAEDRFFHRMLPFENQMILVGGASMISGKRLDLETIDLSTLK